MSNAGKKSIASRAGGRMIKWKGCVASMAPSLFLGTVSISALIVAGAQAETVNTARTTALVSAVDEDHTITQNGSINLDPMTDRGLVQINVAQYNQTLSNDGTLAAENVGSGTHVGMGINGVLAGSVSNSGSIALTSTAVTSGDHRGIDLADIQGDVSNTGSIGVSIDGTSHVQATGIHGGSMSGAITNTGDIAVAAGGSSARAYGINTRATSGSIDNSGTISVAANGTGSSATAYGVRMIGLSGAFQNSGTIDVAANAGSEGSAYGVIAYDVSGDLENTGSLRVVATGDTNPVAIGLEYSDLAATGNITNGGTIEVLATGNGASSASASGISGQTVDGVLTNNGTITVNASGGSWASAEGVSARSVSGSILNTGTIAAQASGSSSAYANGIASNAVSGTLHNSGSITAAATGSSYAYATGVYNFMLDAGATLVNSGTLLVSAHAGGSSASATGIRSGFVSGDLENSGTLQVDVSSASFAYAEGINTYVVNTGAHLRNSGDIQLTVNSGNSSAVASGIQTAVLFGNLENTGTIDVTAHGTYARATGLAAGSTEGGPFATLTGQLTNSGAIAVNATGISNAVAYGMRAGTVSGSATNTGTIDVIASGAANGLATGMDFQQVDATGTVRNSGTITVLADYANASAYYAAGIGGGPVDGTLENTGTIRVTSTNASLDGAETAFLAGIGAFDVAGSLQHDGTIDVTSAGGAGSRAYGIYANTLSGTITVNGDIAVGGSENDYAIFAGDGAGTLNVNTTALIEGLIRVEDHDVTLTHLGDVRVYQFEDANIASGLFTSNVTIDNGAWFVSDAGGSAPVYASVIGEDFAANTLLPFQIGALADGLSYELAKAPEGAVSRNATNIVGAQPSFRTFARLGYSRSDGTSMAGSERSELGSLTAGVTATAGDANYGIGLSLASANASQAANSTDVDGVFLSAEVTRDFGFAELSFGLGYGKFDHTNRRVIGGSPDAIGQFSSASKTAHLGISRDFLLSDRVTLTPRASYRTGVQDIQGYTETGSLANATLPSRTVDFQEAKLGLRVVNNLGAGALSISMDAVHRSVSSPTTVNVSTFGSTASLTAGGSQEETFGQFAIEYTTSFGQNDLLTVSASSNIGSGSNSQTYAAEYAWKF